MSGSCPMPVGRHYRTLSVQAAVAVTIWEGPSACLPDVLSVAEALARSMDTAHVVATQEAWVNGPEPFLSAEGIASRRKHGWMFAPCRLFLRKLDWYMRGSEPYVPTERDEIDRNLCRLMATGRMPDA